MWFKQLFFFQLSPEFVIDSDKLRERLAARPFTPPGGLDWFGEGWVPPAAHIDGPLYEARGYRPVTLRREDKVLPAGVIREFLDKKVAEIEASHYHCDTQGRQLCGSPAFAGTAHAPGRRPRV